MANISELPPRRMCRLPPRPHVRRDTVSRDTVSRDTVSLATRYPTQCSAVPCLRREDLALGKPTEASSSRRDSAHHAHAGDETDLPARRASTRARAARRFGVLVVVVVALHPETLNPKTLKP